MAARRSARGSITRWHVDGEPHVANRRSCRYVRRRRGAARTWDHVNEADSLNMSIRTAIQGKRITRVLVGLAASLSVVTAVSATAHAAPPDPPDPPPSGTIAGTVHLTGCNVSPANIVVRVREKFFHFDNRI